MSPHVLLQADPALGLASWLAFRQPRRVLAAHRLDEVMPVLREVESARQRGQWAAGWVTYEAAPACDPALAAHPAGPMPVAWFGLFDAPAPATEPIWPEAGPPLGGKIDLDAAAYRDRIRRIKEAIARGETYQVNFTLRLRAPWSGEDPTLVFARLHHAQRGGFSAFLDVPDFTICSASPELFFLQQGECLTCRPMKGTAARGPGWVEDEARGAALRASAKDRAENVMIVDMVRNDLGRVAPAGAVHTERLFAVQRLPTLWQMTSTITARAPAGLDTLFRALFPCASVTGAPKVKTTEIIRELETTPRGLYTGTIGFAGPGVAQFNVAIRTLVLDHSRGRADYGVGSGVVWDSDPDREYEECLSKALILRQAVPPFRLLATLAWRPEEGFVLLDRHLARLERAAAYFGFVFGAGQVRDKMLAAVPSFPAGAQRVRLLVDHQGTCTLENQPLPAPSGQPWRVALASRPVSSRDRFLYFKTTRRGAYEQAKAEFPELDEVILWNERGEVTEGCTTNVAVRRHERWVTSPLCCGLLDGVMRQELLARGELVESTITLDEFRRAPAIALFNSLRGWLPAQRA